jgi:hypothetical protein
VHSPSRLKRYSKNIRDKSLMGKIGDWCEKRTDGAFQDHTGPSPRPHSYGPVGN